MNDELFKKIKAEMDSSFGCLMLGILLLWCLGLFIVVFALKR